MFEIIMLFAFLAAAVSPFLPEGAANGHASKRPGHSGRSEGSGKKSVTYPAKQMSEAKTKGRFHRHACAA